MIFLSKQTEKDKCIPVPFYRTMKQIPFICVQLHHKDETKHIVSRLTLNKLRYPLLDLNIELHSKTKKISPQLLMKSSWNYWSRPMAAPHIPALPRSWKTLIKRFIYMDKQVVLGKNKHCQGNNQHCQGKFQYIKFVTYYSRIQILKIMCQY